MGCRFGIGLFFFWFVDRLVIVVAMGAVGKRNVTEGGPTWESAIAEAFGSTDGCLPVQLGDCEGGLFLRRCVEIGVRLRSRVQSVVTRAVDVGVNDGNLESMKVDVHRMCFLAEAVLDGLQVVFRSCLAEYVNACVRGLVVVEGELSEVLDMLKYRA